MRKIWTTDLLGSCVVLISVNKCVSSEWRQEPQNMLYNPESLGRFETVPGLLHFQILALTMVLCFQKLRNVFNY